MNEISKEQLLYMKRTRQHKQFVLFFQLFLFIFFSGKSLLVPE